MCMPPFLALQEGLMLHRVLPWLWRLADEDAGRPEVPWELQQQLLEALTCCPSAEVGQRGSLHLR